MKRLLCIVGSMDAGGAETFLMKIYRNLDKSKYQMDFCVAKKEKNLYEDEIVNAGGKMYRVTPKSKGLLKNFNDIRKIVKVNQYKYVLRISQHSLSSLELFAAKLGGAKVLAFRSSNSNSGGGRSNLFCHYVFRPIANLISNVKIAPSKEAGKFMFGKSKFIIINNGLNLNEYKFSIDNRKKYRTMFNADSKFVIGHVGRFNFQKNHKFLIDIFEEYLKINKDAELWLFGKGELEDEIKSYINTKKLTNYIKTFGVREDVSKIYSAFDCFVFPSLFEGMPNTVVEAQTSGVYCLVSDSISKDCKLNTNLEFISLNSKPKVWAESIKDSQFDYREKAFKIVKDNRYDINDVVIEFEKIIFKNLEN